MERLLVLAWLKGPEAVCRLAGALGRCQALSHWIGCSAPRTVDDHTGTVCEALKHADGGKAASAAGALEWSGWRQVHLQRYSF